MTLRKEKLELEIKKNITDWKTSDKSILYIYNWNIMNIAEISDLVENKTLNK